MYHIYIPYFFFSRLILPRNREIKSLSQFLYCTYSTINCLQYVLNSDYHIFGNFDTKYSYIFEEQISYYFISLFFLLYNNSIMFINNLILVCLLVINQYYNIQNIGLLLLLLNDCPEPFLYLAKFFKYSKNNILKDIFFLIFNCIFIITRLMIIPYIYYLCIEKYGIVNMFTIQIVSLQLLYILWSRIIFNISRRLIIDL